MDKHYKDYIQIGLNIMRYRKEQGLTQDQLSEMAAIRAIICSASKPPSASRRSVCFWMCQRFSAFRWNG